MAEGGYANTVRTAQLVASKGVRRVWRGVGKPWRSVARFFTKAPSRLLIAPQDIRTADPTVAADIYAGFFALSGKVVNTHGQSPFEIPPPSPAWAAALAGFGWLRHLRAADTALARANARALVSDFIAHGAANPALPVWQPRVTARRLLSWISQSPMILEGADSVFYTRFMKALNRHSGRLQSAMSDGIEGEDRLLAAIALAQTGLCSEGAEKYARLRARQLSAELTGQILSDGGHIGRNPQLLIDLLLDLLPLRQAFVARGAEPPQALLNSIDRMIPMLRTFRLGDGSMALFNGMGVTSPHLIATILAYEDGRASGLMNAPKSGYQRIEAGNSIVLMETGAAPPLQFSRRAHAGQLSFEWSLGVQKIVGNCGAPDESRSSMRQAARSTAAHSTLTIEDTSSSRFAPGNGLSRWIEGQIVSGPQVVPVSRRNGPEGIEVKASHDGYAAPFGILHERSLQLANDGETLSGVDRLTASRKGPAALPIVEYALRFHLHPAAQALISEDRRLVQIKLPDGLLFQFDADGLPMAIEPGACFATPEGPKAATQIVVRANSAQIAAVSWRFIRVASSKPE